MTFLKKLYLSIIETISEIRKFKKKQPVEHDELIEMAREAGWQWNNGLIGLDDFLKRFYDLAVEKERKACAEHYLGIMRNAVALEREECRMLCEPYEDYPGQHANEIGRAHV